MYKPKMVIIKRSWFDRFLSWLKYGKSVRVIGYSVGTCKGCSKDSALINSETHMCNDCAIDDGWR